MNQGLVPTCIYRPTYVHCADFKASFLSNVAHNRRLYQSPQTQRQQVLVSPKGTLRLYETAANSESEILCRKNLQPLSDFERQFCSCVGATIVVSACRINNRLKSRVNIKDQLIPSLVCCSPW